jgi:dihydropteroate synthase
LNINNIYLKISQLPASEAAIMGILNLDPLSFYTPSIALNELDAIKRVERMLVDGMDILDVGAMSSRPGAEILSEVEEQARLLPMIRKIRKEFDFLPISVDTLHANTAQQVLELGVHIINDISGGVHDAQMWNVVGKFRCIYILMHMRGQPNNMQTKTYTIYEDLVGDVIQFLALRVKLLQESNIHQIIIDPGFGFSKTIDQNYEMLNKLDIFQIIEKPLLVGLSRKSMFWKRLHVLPEEVLPASIAASTIALMKGARIIRTHDVVATKQAIAVWKSLKNS